MKKSIQYSLSIALALALFSGCSNQPQPQKVVTIDSTLPIPSINGNIADITSMAFEWKPVSDPRVSGFYVYRSSPDEASGQLSRIATIDNRFATHFTDNNLRANTQYQYRFSSTSKENAESVGSETVIVQTLPMIAPVSFFQAIENMPRSAKLLWRPHTNNKINSYIIERKTSAQTEFKQIATIKGRLNAEYIDTNLKDGYIYEYRVRAITFDNLQTDPSEIVKIATKPLPPEIKNITSTNDQPKAITLQWEKSPISDFSHYNIYRSSTPNGTYSYHVKLETNSFVDKIEEDGKFYFYKIRAVDKDGLESAEPTLATQGSTLSKPQTPIAYDVKLNNKKEVEFNWRANDPRTTSYSVIKTTKISWISKESIEINNITQTHFIDPNIKANTTYYYQVMAVDQYGIKSKPTEQLEITYEVK